MDAARPLILWPPIAAVAVDATLFTTMQGLSYPLLTVILDRNGLPATIIGLNAAMMRLFNADVDRIRPS